MRYLFAILVPPLAVLLCGKPLQAVLNFFLWVLFIIPGVIHAILVVNSTKTEERQAELIRAMGGHAPVRSTGMGTVIAGVALIGLVGLAMTGFATLLMRSNSAASPPTTAEKAPSGQAASRDLPAPPPPAPATVAESAEAPAQKPAFPTEVREWTSADGKKIRGSVLRHGGTTIDFRREDGQEFPAMPLDRLGREDQDYLAGLAKEAVAKEPPAAPFSFISRKVETTGHQNEMELYALTGEWDLEAFRALCRKKKATAKAAAFSYIVVFDTKENARFPRSPFTAEYGLEEDAKRHIKAFYTFNKLNGFSEITYYDTNQWEGKASSEKL